MALLKALLGKPEWITHLAESVSVATSMVVANSPRDFHRGPGNPHCARGSCRESLAPEVAHCDDRFAQRVVREDGIARALVALLRPSRHAARVADRSAARSAPWVPLVAVHRAVFSKVAVHRPCSLRQRVLRRRRLAEGDVGVRANAGARGAAYGAALAKPETRLAATAGADAFVAPALRIAAVARSKKRREEVREFVEVARM